MSVFYSFVGVLLRGSFATTHKPLSDSELIEPRYFHNEKVTALLPLSNIIQAKYKHHQLRFCFCVCWPPTPFVYFLL